MICRMIKVMVSNWETRPKITPIIVNALIGSFLLKTLQTLCPWNYTVDVQTTIIIPLPFGIIIHGNANFNINVKFFILIFFRQKIKPCLKLFT